MPMQNNPILMQVVSSIFDTSTEILADAEEWFQYMNCMDCTSDVDCPIAYCIPGFQDFTANDLNLDEDEWITDYQSRSWAKMYAEVKSIEPVKGNAFVGTGSRWVARDNHGFWHG